MHQCSSGTSVPVREGMDGFELGVRQRGVCKNRQIISFDELDQIIDRLGNTVVMWWNEERQVRPQVPAANPNSKIPNPKSPPSAFHSFLSNAYLSR